MIRFSIIALLTMAVITLFDSCRSCEKTVRLAMDKCPELFIKDTVLVTDTVKINGYVLDTLYEWGYFLDSMGNFDSTKVAILEDSINGLKAKLRLTKQGIKLEVLQKDKIIIRKIAVPVIIPTMERPWYDGWTAWMLFFFVGIVVGIILTIRYGYRRT